jgi:hypothetical protein
MFKFIPKVLENNNMYLLRGVPYCAWSKLLYFSFFLHECVNWRVQLHGGTQRERPNRVAVCGLSQIAKFCFSVDFCVIQ